MSQHRALLLVFGTCRLRNHGARVVSAPGGGAAKAGSAANSRQQPTNRILITKPVLPLSLQPHGSVLHHGLFEGEPIARDGASRDGGRVFALKVSCLIIRIISVDARVGKAVRSGANSFRANSRGGIDGGIRIVADRAAPAINISSFLFVLMNPPLWAASGTGYSAPIAVVWGHL